MPDKLGPGMGSPEIPPDIPQDVAKRLLDAWRGEIEARAVYEALAAREKDERRATVLRKMANGEKGHLERVEARMRELGIPTPDPGTVRLSPWQKLQTRIAPVERVLAAREAAEKDEIAVGYGLPTGDPDTDTLFSSIREDERSHARSISALTGQVPTGTAFSPANPKKRLDQILSRESWHQRGSGWISGAIYGANDGLAAVFGIVSGVSGATGASNFVLTAGLAGALASALSMATGAFLAERSVAEVSHANVEQERREIEENPEEEREEVALYYQLKGLSEEEANELAEKLSRSREGLLQVLVAEELGGAQGGENPVEAALAAGLSTGLGAMVPVLPFFWLHGTPAVIWAAIVSLVAHFLVGAAKSLVTLRKWWSAGLEMTLAGVIVGGATYLAGLLFHA
jgi:VIT1/CCC1 family predicted Fe2+/Mn2+ transporter/rubrerythrin